MSGRLPRVSVVIPALDEERTLRAVVAGVLEALHEREIEIVIVDDGSRDATPKLVAELAARDPRIRHVRHERPRGKGSAVRTGFVLATGELFVIQDADLEYSPGDLVELLRPLDEDRADAVYGSRVVSAKHTNRSLGTAFGNQLITHAANLFYGTRFTDLYTGYKAMRAELVRPLCLTSRSFTIEAELTAKLWRCGARFAEVPIRYRPRGYDEGKKIRASDALRAFGAIALHRFTRLMKVA